MKTYIRKSLSVLLSVLMALSVFGGLTLTAGAANTYQISTYAELKAFAAAVNSGETDANAILTENIIAEGTDWTPIGDLAHPYIGTFDGDGHTITGLSTESSAGRDYVGLFGYVGAGGIVQNVGLVGGSIKGQTVVGAVAGENSGKIINCYNMGTVQSTDDSSIVGGVVGCNIEGTVRSCYNTGTVNGLNAYAGGVVGIISEGTVQNCYNTGDVSGAIVGGVAGFNTADNGGSAEISNCFNTGKISGTNMVGGVAGRNNADDYFERVGTASVSNCYNMGAISVNGDYGSAGGVIGFNTPDPGSTASVISCYSAGTVTANGFGIDTGGVIGNNSNGTVQNCYYDSDVCDANNNIGTRLTTAQMTGADALSGMRGFSSENWLVRPEDDFYSYYPHLKGFDLDATGVQLAAETISRIDWRARKVKDGVVEIANYDELKAFASAVNGGNTGLKGILTADVTAEGTDWTPICDLDHPYVGTFDGDGHTITGLSTESSADQKYVGLFGYVGASGVVQNVGLVGGCIKGQDLVGAVAGCSEGQILNCYNAGEVRATFGTAGGVVGLNNGGTVQYCYNTGTVSSDSSAAGGVAGNNDAYNGSNAKISYCFNTGKVSGAINVGGVAGINYVYESSAEISNCYNIGEISVNADYGNVGGVVAFNTAYSGSAEISNCYNMGAISVNADYVTAGGVVGNNLDDFDCTVPVTNCYNAGTLTVNGSDITAGGVIGLNLNGAVQNCYYDSDVCTANNNIGTKLTTAQMTGMDALSNMPGFDTNTWLQKANMATADKTTYFYPHLKGFAYDVTCAVEDWYARREESNIMEISDYAGLKAFAAAVNGGRIKLTGVLKSDIVATDKEWTPIGNELKPYVGAFDGGGHTITGLSNEEAAATPKYAGLFGYLGENAKVKNVQLTGVDLKATSYLGAVAGNAKGAEITNCRNTGEINCNASVGGIIGSIYGAIVSNCCNTGDITSTANNAYVGGIAGFLCGDQSAAGITNCYNTGTVTGKGRYSNVGGIAGYANDRNCTVEIANCYNTGAVTATGTSSRAGGIAASSCVFDGGTVEVINCYSAGAVTADERVGGVVGLKYNSVVRNCWYDDNVCNLSSAVGSVADSDDVKGLHMCEMTGTNALTQMTFSEPSAWLVKENSDICVFYPHLKGFDLDADGDQMDASAIDPADWPAKRNHSHSYGAPVWSWEKCHGKAAATFTCSGCGDTQTVTDNAPTFENGQFTATVEFEGAPYTDTVSWRTGDLIQFGTYPQSEVTDADLKAALDAADKVWASYDYYTGNSAYDGLMRPGDWMKFADFFCGGEKYRAVTFSQYRPDNTATSLDNPYFSSHQDNNGYLTDTVYYFRYEPLTWRVLDPSAGYIMCESVVDAQAYQNMLYYDAVADVYYQAIGSSVYASDYATSSIRDWLNLDFYETAFTAAQKEAIKTTALNNSGYYTLTGDPDHTQYDSAATNDKIFLLSYMDAQNGAYGLSSADDRIAQGTDYAKCQGLQIYSNGLLSGWWLRSAGNMSYGACEVDVYLGWLSNGTDVNYITEGVRPACCLTMLASDAAVSETLYSCAKAGHTYGDTGDARFTCTVCGHVDDDLKAAAELADAKEAAKEALATYKNADDYRPAQKTELETAISDGNDNIDTAANIDAVNTALENAKATVDAIKTDAQLTAEELADAKEAAKESLASYKNANDYLDAQRRDLEDAIDAGNVAIDEATDIDAVNAALENAKALIDEIKTAAEMTVATTPVIVRADAKTKVYGDEDPELTYTVEGLKDGDEITVVLSREPGKDVGTYAITAEIDAGDEYEVTYVPANLTITKRSLLVIVFPRCKREGKPDPMFYYHAYGKVDGDEIVVKAKREPGEEPGQYTITPVIDAGPNYKVSYRTAKLTIEPKECPLCGEIHECGTVDILIDMLHRFIYRFKQTFGAFQVNSIIQGDC